VKKRIKKQNEKLIKQIKN